MTDASPTESQGDGGQQTPTEATDGETPTQPDGGDGGDETPTETDTGDGDTPTSPPEATPPAAPSDADKDGFPSIASGGQDCNDGDASINPDASETCDGIDQDCDGDIDEGTSATWYLDRDGDGYGEASTSTVACEPPPSYVANALDCSDLDENAYPGAQETCDPGDDDCDGEVDEDLGSTFYLDEDGDGYGATGAPADGCEPPDGYAVEDGDCDDGDPQTYPGAVDYPDGQDNDCDGSADNGLIYYPSCAAIAKIAPYAASGPYTLDPDGEGPEAAFGAYCLMKVDGGGWQLISARHGKATPLFEEKQCGSPIATCSGYIPEAQIPDDGRAPQLLFAVEDFTYWVYLDGLSPISRGGLFAFLTLNLELADDSNCLYPAYCNATTDPDLYVGGSSASIDFDPYLPVGYQSVNNGGLKFYSESLDGSDNVASFNDSHTGTTTYVGPNYYGEESYEGDWGAIYFRFAEDD